MDTISRVGDTIGCDIITPGTSTVAKSKTIINFHFARFQFVSNRAFVNALNMSGLSIPPNSRFAQIGYLLSFTILNSE